MKVKLEARLSSLGPSVFTKPVKCKVFIRKVTSTVTERWEGRDRWYVDNYMEKETMTQVREAERTKSDKNKEVENEET
jgi:hypothetical protein